MVTVMSGLNNDYVNHILLRTFQNNPGGQNTLMNIFERLTRNLEEEEKLIQILYKDHEKMQELYFNSRLQNSPGSPLTLNGIQIQRRPSDPRMPSPMASPRRYGNSPPSARSPQTNHYQPFNNVSSPRGITSPRRGTEQPNSSPPTPIFNLSMDNIIESKPRITNQKSSPITQAVQCTDSFSGYESYESDD
jgi:hypothetical protein